MAAGVEAFSYIEELEENSIYDGEVVYALEYRKPCSKVCDWNFTAFHHIFCKFCALRSRMEFFTKYVVQKIRVYLRQSEGLFYANIKKKNQCFETKRTTLKLVLLKIIYKNVEFFCFIKSQS